MAAMTGPAGELPDYAERVLAVVERIPPGRVMTYGDVAEWLEEGGPRQVGRVMSLYGGTVPWWRVVRADGTPPPCHEGRALAHYRQEGTPLRGGRGGTAGHAAAAVRVDMRRARWDGEAGGSGDGDGAGERSARRS
ncbi:O(6)-alkylguanine repair protein YbaZ [Streptomyces pini]|uniref:O(6)-alkylguanine repair protein YbaZ n=2 Tax=Streptomyces pini TaxID=1520580 RepID=A0A1I3VBR4_9ACTN|nr:MGMT family protein [Streptomyces pini]SFJ92904.1 O(6)-alkylguanine repair protein YbaZ [Streptomyces pini]